MTTGLAGILATIASTLIDFVSTDTQRSCVSATAVIAAGVLRPSSLNANPVRYIWNL